MVAIQLALIWAGYTITWWGYAMIKGKSVGLADLVNPGQVKKVDGAFGADIASKFTGTSSTASTMSPIGSLAAAPTTDIPPPQLAPLPSQGQDLTRIGRAQ